MSTKDCENTRGWASTFRVGGLLGPDVTAVVDDGVVVDSDPAVLPGP